jgi:hypothetical protein
MTIPEFLIQTDVLFSILCKYHIGTPLKIQPVAAFSEKAIN